MLLAVVLAVAACSDSPNANESTPASERNWTDKTALLSLGSASGAPGENVTLEVSLAGEASPAGLQWSLAYPAADLLFRKSQTGDAAGTVSKSIQCSDKTGRVTCIVFGLSLETISNGVVGKLTFTIAPATDADSARIVFFGVAATSPEGFAIPTKSTEESVVIQILPLSSSATSGP